MEPTLSELKARRQHTEPVCCKARGRCGKAGPGVQDHVLAVQDAEERPGRGVPFLEIVCSLKVVTSERAWRGEREDQRRAATVVIWMVKRGEIGDLDAAWLRCHGLPAKYEKPSLVSRVWRAASSLQMQPHEPVVASCGFTKTPP